LRALDDAGLVWFCCACREVADVADVTQYAYDGERRQIQVTDAAGQIARVFYDANGNVTRTASQAPGGMWLTQCKTYNMADKVSQARGPVLVANDQTCPGTTSDITISDYVYDDQDRLMAPHVVKRLAAVMGVSPRQVLKLLARVRAMEAGEVVIDPRTIRALERLEAAIREVLG